MGWDSAGAARVPAASALEMQADSRTTRKRKTTDDDPAACSTCGRAHSTGLQVPLPCSSPRQRPSPTDAAPHHLHS